MMLLLWLVLAVLSWPLAVLALILYPLIWLLSIPFRLVGISVEGALGLLRAILTLPKRALAGPATMT
jgi:hypothetical protein